MSLSIQVPTVGQANSTEAVKVTNSLTNLSSWANGNIAGSDLSPSAAIADTQLASPNNSVRRVLLTVRSDMSTAGAATYILTSSGSFGSAGNQATDTLYIGDQAADLAVSGKTAEARIRVIAWCNSVAPAITYTYGLYAVTSIGGSSGSMAMTYNGTALAGSTVALASPAASSATTVVSGQFALPTTSGITYALGFAASGTPAAGAVGKVLVQLLAYNA